MIRTLILVTACFTAAAGAAQPQPLAPAGMTMLFFDWGKGEVRRDDEALLDKIAEQWRSHPSSRLQLTGHTDRSGSAAGNRQSGMKRAATVRAELEKRGVQRNAMSLASFGEDQPLVPTEDGVREVQNRRVEIRFEE